MAQAIVVGGGLAGLSAAHTLLERGANVLLLDKQPYVYLGDGSCRYSLPFFFVKVYGGKFYKGHFRY